MVVFDLLGFEHVNTDKIPYDLEFKPPNLIQITEESLIFLAGFMAWGLSILSISLAFKAEINQENNFHFTNAFTLGGAAIIILSEWVGFIVVFVLFFIFVVFKKFLRSSSGHTSLIS